MHPQTPLKTILAAVDGSPEAERGLHLAHSLAQPFNAKLVLLRVEEYQAPPIAPGAAAATGVPFGSAAAVPLGPTGLPPYGSPGMSGITTYPPVTDREVAPAQPEVDAEEYLRSSAVGLPESDVQVVMEVGTGDPTEAIIDYAESHNADLIVMGTSGRGKLDKLIFGSTSEGVVRKAPCPVLLIRADDNAE
jgi:nucleotide-binding universal stress UspA family protein